MSNFNATAFLEDANKVHLTNPDTIPDYEVREKLNTFVDYGGNPRFSTALDEICTNVVGRTMFKMLMRKLPSGQMLKITDIGPVEALSSLSKQKGSSYENYEVKINLNVYDRYGLGIPEKQYYCIDKDDITIKLKSIAGSIFHEFTHCLHETEDATRYALYGAGAPLKGNPWTDKEERRTISGYIEADVYWPVDTYDPICDNCFHLYDAIAKHTQHLSVQPTIIRPIQCHQIRVPAIKKTPYRQAIAKPILYLPRFSHLDYRSSTPSKPEKKTRDRLLQFYRTLNFNLEWVRKYIVI
jgi:hypothetical protein